MRHWSLACAGMFVAAAAHAQDPPQPATHVVRGVVFDSVAGTPLAGAQVQIRSRDSALRVFSETTDSAGRYRIAGIPRGRYLIGFYHDALTALGLDTPLRAVDVASAASLTIDLAIPSAPVVRASLCAGDSATPYAGMLAGFVRGAQGHEALAGAKVAVEWRAIAVDAPNVRAVWQHTVATVSTNGTYLACGVPVDAPLRVHVLHAGYREIAGPLIVPVTGVARRDFHLANTAAVSGVATLRGRVVRENGKLVAQGRAGIPALAVDVPIRDGEFTLTGLPIGTWLVSVRAIGLAADSMLFDVTEGEQAARTITVGDRVPRLDPVSVIGERSTREARILDDVLRRHRAGAGTAFLPGNEWFDNAQYPADVVRVASGFRYVGPDSVVGRQMARYGCTTAVYLNGAPIPSLKDLNAVVSMKDILAIEAYPDVLFAPPQWRNLTPYGSGSTTTPRKLGGTGVACSVLLVWTRIG